MAFASTLLCSAAPEWEGAGLPAHKPERLLGGDESATVGGKERLVGEAPNMK
jgi:hypothetical protein